MLRFLVGRCLSHPTGPAGLHARFWLAGAAWEATIFAIYLYNGVADVVEDRLNHSTRPIASGRLPRSFAAGVAAGAAAFAVLAACLLGGPYPLLTLATLGLGYAYVAPRLALKRHSGTAGLTVLAAGLFTFAAGAAVDGRIVVTGPLVVFAVALSLWMGAVGALAKDLTDIVGDALAGRQTTAVLHGAAAVHRQVGRNAALIAAGLALTAVAAPALRVPAAALLLGAAAITLWGRIEVPARRHARRSYRMFMVTQYAAHIAVVAVAVLSQI
jgi:4-hydroxybenzoate polyprenyltransferase